mmetsp:Transcript_39076/g.37388  ORF Transcript_39076/g.37388 Transcript_39076/m.37388 type:complete len:131 (+) Transcript_39076:2-394(+)
MSSAIDPYFWLMLILAYVLSFGLGQFETDALAMAYSAGSLSRFKCLLLGSIFEFIGSLFCSREVSETLSNKIILNLDKTPDQTVKEMMLCVTISTMIFVAISYRAGVPISGTHAVVGSFIGAGISGVGAG